MMAAKTKSKGKTIAKLKHEIPASLIDVVCQRLARNQRMRRTLPANGRLHIDRQLPFLCVYRGGGLTKDAIYLRGLQAILRYVQGDGDLKPLFVGKMAVEHIPIIRELQHRNVLNPVSLVPRYLQNAAAIQRLELLWGGNRSVVDLVSQTPTKKGVAP